MDKQAYYKCKVCGECFIVTYSSQPKPPQDMICPICGCCSFEIEYEEGFTLQMEVGFNENKESF